MIIFKDVHKYYGAFHALKGITLEIKRGEVVVVCGPSGSGKSTLIRCINELELINSGTLVVNGRNLADPKTDINRLRAEIGMVFQHFNLVHRSKVLTNVLAGRLGYVNPAWSLLNRFPREDIEKAFKQLERVGIADKADQRADELSGGQQQRVGIARALMQDPKMILADEPVASLDPVLAHSIMKHLEEINKNDGVTVLCSLHFLDLVHRYADRVVALNEGKLVFEGLPKEIDDAQFKEIYGKEAERIQVI